MFWCKKENLGTHCSGLRRAKSALPAAVFRQSNIDQCSLATVRPQSAERKVLSLVCKPRIGWARCPLPLGELVHAPIIYLRPVDSRKREMSRDGKFQRRQYGLVQ